MPSSKKPKTPPKTKLLDKKKNDVQDFWIAPSVMFYKFPKKLVFEGVFGFFWQRKALFQVH